MSDTAPDRLGSPNGLAVVQPGVILVCPDGYTMLVHWHFDGRQATRPASLEEVVDWLAVDFPSTVRQDAIFPTMCTFCAAREALGDSDP